MRMRRILSCILMPAYLSSCTSWHVQSVSPERVIEDDQPAQVRVATGSSEVILRDPRISGDTLIGTAKGDASWSDSRYAVADTGSVLAIPLADISSIAVKKGDAGKSVLLGVGILAGLGLAFAALYAASCDGSTYAC